MGSWPVSNRHCGVVARLEPQQPSTLAWLLLVVVTLALWVWRSRRAAAVGDEAAGLALTGAVMCLVSPVTWVHHLVWLLPALILLVDHATVAPAGSRRRRGLLAAVVVGYALLISRIVWVWEKDFTGADGFLGSNTYVWISCRDWRSCRCATARHPPGHRSSRPAYRSSARWTGGRPAESGTG